MRNPRLASRYAKSLLDLSIEKNALEEVLKDMELVMATAESSRELKLLLRSPVVAADKKTAIIQAVFKDKIGAISLGFIELLIKKGREFFLPEMATEFVRQYKAYKRIHVVRLTTASEIDEQIRMSIERKVKAMISDGSIELETKVDAELIGGFVLEMGDKLFDASILRDLNDIKKQFIRNEYVPLI